MMTKNPWHSRAIELANWALDRVFVRTDRFGGYYTAEDDGIAQTRKCAKPALGAQHNALTKHTVILHFRASRECDVIGSYHLTEEPESVGKMVSIDIDAHDANDDPHRNERYALEIYKRLTAMGFHPLLATWGQGSYHLHVLFSELVPGEVLYRFGLAITADWEANGFTKPVESFPKQSSVPKGKFGNWLRLVGRHHTRDVWASIWDGDEWLNDAPAVAHLLSLRGDSPTMIPTPKPQPKSQPQPVLPPRLHTPVQDRRDVFAHFNQQVTLADVVRWHVERGHKICRESANRVDLTRDGKRSGESFNVTIKDGIPITYSFSTNAGLPAGVGLTPAQVRCWYARGNCDQRTMNEFASELRREFGWEDQPKLAPRPATPQDANALIAEMKADIEEMRKHAFEMAAAIIELQEQVRGLRYVRA